jgi:hypothetical protein
MAADPLTFETGTRRMEAIEAPGGIPIVFQCPEVVAFHRRVAEG